MAIDFELHRRALGAATNLAGILRYRGDYAGDTDPVRAAYIAAVIREEWARLQEAMPGVLAGLPGVPGETP